ncbi:hypothetical protein [Blastococcus goldschmidtiae]|uniref:Uncharacterized protein n=1 Tax=Blastococcus goldschmidtiae TaxID=3075546 RepID=A0ABU2K859_9ACTN|nr:hypothetical protein [Blastococcus sp. DSM 46792]MDT0276374.1 hypothetical protein [Blastococcus sp. DSM 46792]
MTGRAAQWRLAGEVGWLVVSTTLLIVIAAQATNHQWRLGWLVLLTVNTAVVVYRIGRMRRRLRPGRSDA